jgi:uncharacterized membrane protein YfcA
VIDQLPALTVALLCCAALAAGWIDSVVGGGGAIQMPALLIGLPDAPVATISGTNKLSSFAGVVVATGTYLRKVRVHWPTAAIVIAGAFAGSSVGARLVTLLPRAAFTPIIIVAVALVGVYTWRKRDLGQETNLRLTPGRHRAAAAAIGLVCGVWDGLVGPGTGTFLVLGFVAVLGYGFLPATALAKIANLTTNLAALLVLGTGGHVLWRLGACMAAANIVGAAIGSRMAIARGNAFIRKVFLATVVIIEARLLYDAALLLGPG